MPRDFTPAEDALIQSARAGRIHMRALRKQLRTSPNRIYVRMRELGLDPYRKPDCRRQQARQEAGSDAGARP